MAARLRLDAELVRRGMARSRQQAAELIAAGRVQVHGMTAAKPATAVARDATLSVQDSTEPQWASRGAHKLLGALEAFAPVGFTVAGQRCLDAGASTGGFTDVLLRHGAASVLTVDVGYGQLAWRLRTDPRVRVLDRTNVRYLTLADVGEPADLVVADLSFISLRTVLPALVECSGPEADLLPMVKPQFEVGRDRLGSGGVVRDPALRLAALTEVTSAARALGLALAGAVASPLPGPAGNVEYFLWLRCTERARRDAVPDVGDDALRAAVESGPQ